MGKDQRRDREQDYRRARAGGRDRERSRDRGQSWDRHREGDRQRQKDKDRQRVRTRSRERGLEEEPGHSRDWSKGGRASWEEEGNDEREWKARGRQRVPSGPEEVFDELTSNEGRGDTREVWDTRQGEGPSRKRSHTHPNEETGRIVHRGSGAVVSEMEYGLSEATKGLTKLDLREQELKDMEVARKLQEEEIKVRKNTREASKMHVRAAQVAQDEEIARLMMEQEKKEYRKNRERENEREREKEKERERERLAMERMALERRRQEGDFRPNSEDVVRPRTRDEHEYQRQRNHNKPARPPQPRAHDYENVNYGYSDHPAPHRAPTRPEAALRGAYYKR
ncbi:Coiled-coil domain-containing protein 50 Protein Ymer [Larimichthys crocea]|uniref:Coiled-coil domain-containing protein 50 Protein Ymer n=1 Tax=Larimichthys crocea TaxID=215358 RepID=A0A6G0IRR3_LARCR|nr:Coiled-coil domain-containing protein 50 Protein Ymer [Larimichthys crocea]